MRDLFVYGCMCWSCFKRGAPLMMSTGLASVRLSSYVLQTAHA